MSYFFNQRAELLVPCQVGGYGPWDDSNKKEKKGSGQGKLIAERHCRSIVRLGSTHSYELRSFSIAVEKPEWVIIIVLGPDIISNIPLLQSDIYVIAQLFNKCFTLKLCLHEIIC